MKKTSLKKIKEEIESCKKPLIFFHDDSDGLASFLLVYKHVGDGKGVVIKTKPEIKEGFFRKVEEYGPDKIFILDIALVEQEFIDACKKTPIVWIDHHPLIERTGLKYFNPRKDDPEDMSPVSQVIYETLDENLWIAMTGIVGDWQLPKLAKKFSKEYPELLPKEVKNVEEARFETRLGKLISVFNTLLKGKTQEAMASVKILTRIDDPEELLAGETPRAKYLIKRYNTIDKDYQLLLEDVRKELKKQKEEHVFVFNYRQDKTSFTGEISNEVLYRHPEKKIILICREKSGEMKCSLRTGTGINLLKAVTNALKDVDGYGGGHEKACGACVKADDFSKFVDNLKREAKHL